MDSEYNVLINGIVFDVDKDMIKTDGSDKGLQVYGTIAKVYDKKEVLNNSITAKLHDKTENNKKNVKKKLSDNKKEEKDNGSEK